MSDNPVVPFLATVVFSLALLSILHERWDGRGYARGYCRALDAAVVADSLCVRGNSIVAHIKEAK
jgi:hypothetical protein